MPYIRGVKDGKNFVTALTQQNSTETTKSYVSTDYTVPQGVTSLREIGLQIMATGLTSLESVSAILEVESDDSLKWSVQQFVTDSAEVVTSGAVVIPSRVHDVNIPVEPGSHLRFGVTFNEALTVQPSWRVFGKFV